MHLKLKSRNKTKNINNESQDFPGFIFFIFARAMNTTEREIKWKWKKKLYNEREKGLYNFFFYRIFNYKVEQNCICFVFSMRNDCYVVQDTYKKVSKILFKIILLLLFLVMYTYVHERITIFVWSIFRDNFLLMYLVYGLFSI